MAGTSASRYVALLRGINLAGKNTLPMLELKAMFVSAGCGQVSTYIASGNVIFECSAGSVGKLPTIISNEIHARFGHGIPVILRSTAEMKRIVEANPFLPLGPPERTLHVSFLEGRPTQSAVAELDANRSAPDAFHVIDREIYLHLPNGMGRTRLTNAYFDSKLGTISTTRNWNTVLKLLALLES